MALGGENRRCRLEDGATKKPGCRLEGGATKKPGCRLEGGATDEDEERNYSK
jgi:hypothetical protein